MSNHWHGVVSDPEGRLPDFLARFHRLVARAQNASLGHWENLWSSDKPSVVLLVSEMDVLEKIAYTLANPTEAGLVRSPYDWPGVISHRFHAPLAVEMPDVFFDQQGDLPDEVELEFKRPEVFRALGDAVLSKRIQDAVAKRVRTARTDLAARGLKFLGRRGVLQQRFSDSPRTPAPRRNPNPRIAAHATPTRVWAIQRMLEFVKAYRIAFLAWRSGDRSISFPFGTYAMRIHSGVACAQPP
jgi:hypothetical protein